MLRNIDPLLTPDLLYVMAAMGHGDELAIVDSNFPAYSVSRGTVHGGVIDLPGTSLPQVVAAVLSLVVLDEFVDAPVRRMAVIDGPDEIPEVQQEVQAVIDSAAGRPWPMGALERFAFYDAARASYAVVITGERRVYGNVLVKKGVVPPGTKGG